jgi:hypothetical protein
MHLHKRTCLAILLALTLTMSMHAQTCVPITVSHRLTMVPVMLNGQGPFLFVLDTGAETTMIDAHTTLNLPKVRSNVQLLGLTGGMNVDVRALQSITVGGLTVGPIGVLSYNLRATSPDIMPAIGILGADVLSRAGAVSINYQTGCLTITEAK